MYLLTQINQNKHGAVIQIKSFNFVPREEEESQGRVDLGSSVKEYIEYYSFKELLSSLSRVEKIVNYVIDRTRIENKSIIIQE